MKYLTSGSDYLARHEGFKLVGRDQDMERLTAILFRSKSSSMILVGAGGVGCTALCLGLQASKNDTNAPFDVVSKRIYWLETDELFSSSDNSELNDRFSKVLSVLHRTSDSLLIVEDARDFIEACRTHGCSHFINSLNHSVKSKKTQVILEARDEDLDLVLKAHSDMRECYTIYDVQEPVNEALLAIVTETATGLQKHHGIKITTDALDAAIELTTKYRTRDAGLSRAQPERATTLLDRALSSYRLSVHKRHPEVTRILESKVVITQEIEAKIDELSEEFSRIQDRMKRLNSEIRKGEAEIFGLDELIDLLKASQADRAKEMGQPSAASGFSMTDLAASVESPEVRSHRSKQRQIQHAIDNIRIEFNELTSKFNSSLALTRDHVVAEFSRISGISASKLNEDEREKLRNLEANINLRIFGQANAVARTVNAIKVAKVGRRNKNKPQASFLYLGPSGVGKTEMAKVLALNLLDSQEALTRFDMSEYMEKHAVAKLIGAPPGYEGFEVGGILTNAMRKNPYRILLFDEIEKAHPDVFNVFLQILDDGRLTDNVGRVVNFSDSIILMTTNLGQKPLLDESLSPEEKIEQALAIVSSTYRPEFLNRFAGRENIVCFDALGIDSIERIVRRELADVNESYVSNGIHVSIADEDVAAFCQDKYNPEIGARGLPGFIQANLEPILANTVLDAPDYRGPITMKYVNGKFEVKAQIQNQEKAA